MFQKMCCAIISLVLVATAGVYPEAHLEAGSIDNACAIVELLTNMGSEAALCSDATNLFFQTSK